MNILGVGDENRTRVLSLGSKPNYLRSVQKVPYQNPD